MMENITSKLMAQLCSYPSLLLAMPIYFWGIRRTIQLTLLLQVWANLITWWCYIDDCVIVWKRNRYIAKGIPAKNNNFNLWFTHEYSRESVIFLDLNIFVIDNGLKTHLYKKETDCKGYIPYIIGYHKWLNNILRGKFAKIKRNRSDPVLIAVFFNNGSW